MSPRHAVGAEPREGHRSGIPSSGFWTLFCVCQAALALIWLPIAALQHIDAVLLFVTWPEFLGDIALMLVLLAGASLALTTVASLSGGLLQLAAGVNVGRGVGWVLVCLPITVLCAWQFAFAVKLWVEQVSGIRLNTGAIPHRQLLLVLPVLVFAITWRLAGTARLIRAVTAPLIELKIPALLLTVLAIACVTWQQPTFVGNAGRLKGVRPPATSSAPDIYLISLDSLAAKDAALCNIGPTPMPRLRTFASQATCFTRYYAVSNLTLPTTATMETGALPWKHWAMHGGRVAPHLAASSLGQALTQLGYNTHSISAAPGASPLQHGTYRGYDTAELASSPSLHASLFNAIQKFPDSHSLPSFLSAILSFLWATDIHRLDDRNPYPPEVVYDAADSWLQREARDRPTFMWLHSWPPHSPYLPPKSTKYRLLPPGELEQLRDFMAEEARYDDSRQPAIDKQRLRYRETIMGADEALGRFFDALKAQGRLDDALIVVTADHGESFERGLLGHGSDMLHEAVIHIPLLIKLPGQRVGRAVDVPVSQADLAPTLVELTSGKPLPLAEGRSLRPALLGDILEPRPVFSMSMERESRFRPIRGGHYAVIDGQHKLLYHLAQKRSELYDLATDPHEEYDLATIQRDTVARLQALLTQRIAEAERQRIGQFIDR